MVTHRQTDKLSTVPSAHAGEGNNSTLHYYLKAPVTIVVIHYYDQCKKIEKEKVEKEVTELTALKFKPPIMPHTLIKNKYVTGLL